MAFWVYILECTDHYNNHTFYTGYTNNLLRRFKEHSSGRGARYTKGKKVQLRYYETHTSQREAMRREIQIKRYTRKKKQKLIAQFPINSME